MKKIIILLAILVVIVIQLSWTMGYRNYVMPRSAEAHEATQAYLKNPSETTMANVRHLTAQDASRNLRHDQILFGLMFIGDIFALYLFWNYAFKKPRPKTSQV